MANPEHLALLKQAVGVWNKWRYENLDINPDLSWANLIWTDLSGAYLLGAKLYQANLSEANLSGADLTGANLSWADLYQADLSWADLSWADLSWANLSWASLYGANLAMSQIIGTDFHNATLTGACIKDWYITHETDLDGVICEYVYLDEQKTERRPINGNFAPGEFTSLYKKIIENTDLILRKTPENDNTFNNQGVQFYSNSIIHTWENLRFRSKTEIKIAEALDRTGVLFVPNSLARLTTPKGRANKEADFLICYNGKWGVLEVDGPFHTAERRVEEQERERIFKKNGIKVVERFDSERCYNNPDEVVQEFFKMIEIGYS
ncbi:pentapeptide repeat-containing protein [Dolichospermum heterosporum]|uniref:Pentapeptide repeat-containing protein n=1 Tax=Dolichospermum heterosporum TAC447 TaxID=747523 RepID=A0ABY5LXR9_9CYAN|nr:pentapeptide repeat-containing protein [Dolichospermum heterosporum]UUO14384.1 pentapeptide repeat-containing protein [Dolichospermum heterosporum TAC447]